MTEKTKDIKPEDLNSAVGAYIEDHLEDIVGEYHLELIDLLAEWGYVLSELSETDEYNMSYLPSRDDTTV